MRRREFITLIGGSAAAWPLVARAQQTMPVIGFLHPTSSEASADRLRAFRLGLKDTGYVEGENVAVEYRWAEGQFDRLPVLAAELVRRQVAVIVAATIGVTVVAMAATTARPGGNLTGVNFFNYELVEKRLELLRELVPGAASVAVLVNPTNARSAEITVKGVDAAARAIGLQVRVLNASTSHEIDAAFATFVRERPDALFVGGDTVFASRRVQLAHLATRHAIPAIYAQREYTEAGGLMSYGTNVADAYRQVGFYTGRILKGAKPADLPVVQSTKFELVINAQTARTLGLTVPPALLARADEVIE